ncbi:MAG: glycosyltransferase, partial [Chloroflexota bacterium]
MTIQEQVNPGNTDRLKILICLLYYLPHRTGMQLYIQRVAEELVRRGHEVTVLAARHRPHLKPKETINGVNIVRVWAPPIPISRGMLMPLYPYVANKLIRQHDVVSIHTPMLETALIDTLARLAGKDLTVSVAVREVAFRKTPEALRGHTLTVALEYSDATAAGDTETEHEILQAMDNAMKGR